MASGEKLVSPSLNAFGYVSKTFGHASKAFYDACRAFSHASGTFSERSGRWHVYDNLVVFVTETNHIILEI